MYTILDFETTGLDASKEQVIEIGAKKFNAVFEEIGSFQTLVSLREGKELSQFIEELTGLDEIDLQDGLDEQSALTALEYFIGDDLVVAQFASFDLSFLPFGNNVDFICTKSMFNLLYPDKKARLKDIVAHYGFKYENHHRAFDDVEMTAKAFYQLVKESNSEEVGYINVMVKPDDRELKFVPDRAKVINKGQINRI